MKLHKEGFKILRNELLIFLMLNFITYWNSTPIFYYLTLPVSIIVFMLSVYFFRVPNRNFLRKEGIVYAPCDGKVVVIEQTKELEFYQDERIQLSIFMSPLNVHNNLYPISGETKYTKYHKGKYLVAWHPKASTDNERSTVVVENEKISILFRQIAGALAKRIVTYAKIGDKAIAAKEFGFIKFGSRVDVFLPIGTEITVRIGDKVKGGISEIAKF